MENKTEQSFLIYHLPHNPQKAEIRRALESLIGYNRPIELCFPQPLQPKIFTESMVIRLTSPQLIKRLQEEKNNLIIRGCRAEVVSYSGRETEEEIESYLAPRVVYVAGIPVKAAYPDLYAIASGVRGFREFHIPRNRSGSNRHFGFIIVHSSQDKEDYLNTKKIKNGSLKLFFKDFDYISYVRNFSQLKSFNVHSDFVEISRQKRKVLKSLFKGPPQPTKSEEKKPLVDAPQRGLVRLSLLQAAPSEKDHENSLRKHKRFTGRVENASSSKYRFNSIRTQGSPFLP